MIPNGLAPNTPIFVHRPDGPGWDYSHATQLVSYVDNVNGPTQQIKVKDPNIPLATVILQNRYVFLTAGQAALHTVGGFVDPIKLFSAAFEGEMIKAGGYPQ